MMYQPMNNIIDPVTGKNLAKEQMIKNIVAPENKEDSEKKEMPKFINKSPLVFSSLGSIMRIDSKSLALQISSMFKGVFHDYEGTALKFEGNKIKVYAYFSNNQAPVPDGKIKNLVDLTSPKNASNLYEKKQIINNRFQAKLFSLNDTTKEILSEFLINPKSNWAKLQRDIRRPLSPNNMYYFRNGNNAEQLLLELQGLDIYKILKKLYGNKMVTKTEYKQDENGKKVATNILANCNYEIRFIKYMNMEGNLPIFIIHVERYNIALVDEYTKKEFPSMAYSPNTIYF